MGWKRRKVRQTKNVVIVLVRYNGGLGEGADVDGDKVGEKWMASRDIQGGKNQYNLVVDQMWDRERGIAKDLPWI